MFTEREQRVVSIQKRGDRLKRFGLTDQTLVMGMTIKFIDSDSTLGKILQVSRDFNELLREEILKQALLKASPERLMFKR